MKQYVLVTNWTKEKNNKKINWQIENKIYLSVFIFSSYKHKIKNKKSPYFIEKTIFIDFYLLQSI